MKLNKLMSVAVALAAVVSTASAQAPKPVTYGVTLGGSIPTGDFGKGAKTGFTVGGTAEITPAKLPFAVRFDLGYNNNKLKGIDETFHLYSGTVNAVKSFSAKSAFVPYVIGGLGVYHGRAAGNSDTDFGLNGGAGISMPLSGFNTFVEARYNHVFTSGSSLSYIPVVFGIRF